MDIVFLVYGLAFLLLGVVLVIWPTQGSRFALARLTPWLAGFAFAHGLLEWMDLWRVVRGDSPLGMQLRPLLLLASYALLLEFSRRLLVVALADAPRAPRRWASAPVWHLAWLTGLGLACADSPSFWRDLGIWARYLYGFPAALLTGAGFLLYCRRRIRPQLESGEFRTVWRGCFAAGGAFIAYGGFAGLVVPAADWGLPALLNQDSFLAATGIPVQIFRAACACVAAFGTTFALRIFHLEREHSLRLALAASERALAETDRLSRHNRLLLESVGEGIFGVDREGRTTFINPLAEAMFGYGADELIGQPIHALTHHSHADGSAFPGPACPTAKTLLDGQPRHVENDTFWRQDGSHFPVAYYTAALRDGGQIVGAVVVFEDISERCRIQAELEAHRNNLERLVDERTAQLRLAEENARLLLAASANGLYGVRRDGQISFINEAGARLLGYAPEELVGRPVHATLHHTRADGSPFPAADCPMLAALLRGESVHDDDDLFWTAGGEALPVATATRPLRRDGEIVGAVVSFSDIRQRKAVDAARDLALAEAERLIAVKSQFLANMSHEIRTPLNAILGMAHLIRRSGVTPQQADRLGKIDIAGQHLLDIINAVLDLAKIEAGKFALAETEVNLGGIVSNVASMLFERAQNKGIELLVETRPLPRHLLGDAARLQQALLNFATNAVKFTEQGQVVLRVLPLEETEHDVLVRLEVEDSGIGIAPEVLPRLFAAFQQADGSATRQHGGTGLGLAISRNLAQLMGGDAGAESTPGVGSRFWLTARLKKGTAEHRATPLSAASADAEARLAREHAGRRLLVVEDEAVNREVTLDLLADSGLAIDCAEDGAQAVAKVAAARYDLILMDIQMPVLDGLAATRQIRGLPNGAAVPIVAMTANAFADDKVRCLDAGMDDFLTKPVVPDMLYATLLGWLNRRHPPGGTLPD